MMQLSAEIRWFWRSQGRNAFVDWFKNVTGALPDDQDNPAREKRVDAYLALPDRSDLGVKRRGHSGIEVKGWIGNAPVALVGGRFFGPIEWWCKWPLEGIQFADEKSAITVEKTRWTRKYEAGRGGFARVHAQARPKMGCNVELAHLFVVDQEWWSSGFEAFGMIDDAQSILQKAADELATHHPEPLPQAAEMASYPEWVKRFAGESRRTSHPV